MFGGGRSQRERVVLLTSEPGHVLLSRPTMVEVSLDHGLRHCMPGFFTTVYNMMWREVTLCSPRCTGREVMPHLLEGRVCT